VFRELHGFLGEGKGQFEDDTNAATVNVTFTLICGIGGCREWRDKAARFHEEAMGWCHNIVRPASPRPVCSNETKA
jgi:hypothetical protein